MGEWVCAGQGAEGDRSRFDSGPGSAVGPRANHVTRILMALLQEEADSARVFDQHWRKPF